MLEFAVARSGCVRAPDTSLSSFVKIPFSVSVAWSQVSWLLREDPFLKVSLPHNTRVRRWRRVCTLTSRLPLPRRWFTRSWFYSKKKKRGGILQQIAIRVCILHWPLEMIIKTTRTLLQQYRNGFFRDGTHFWIEVASDRTVSIICDEVSRL